MPHRALTRRLKQFRRDAGGMVSVEFAFYAPLLLGVFAMLFTFFDAFKQESVNLKAAYTISDLISRETNYVNNAYIDSMYKLTGLLVRQESELSIRISVVRWDEEDNRYYVDWSKVRGGSLEEWSDGTIQNVKDRLPDMPDQERVILVETRSQLVPVFNIGLSDLDINNFVFTRPRFAPQVVFVDDTVNGKSHDDKAHKFTPPVTDS
ncbi:TadE/TadG family type IV pilus assembly protein [Roseobacteraceae bacterium NS-SX3]